MTVQLKRLTPIKLWPTRRWLCRRCHRTWWSQSAFLRTLYDKSTSTHSSPCFLYLVRSSPVQTNRMLVTKELRQDVVLLAFVPLLNRRLRFSYNEWSHFYHRFFYISVILLLNLQLIQDLHNQVQLDPFLHLLSQVQGQQVYLYCLLGTFHV